MDKEDVIAEINEAFDGVEQPQEITLHVAQAHDRYIYASNFFFRRLDFIGRWQDVPREHLRCCENALSYLDEVGMRFYLSAYMVWYLRNYTSPNELHNETVLSSLNPYLDDERMSRFHKERFSLFNQAQLQACAHFVRFCAEDTTGCTFDAFAQEIYDSYWRQYDEI
jgi:hypothetical protein